MTFIHKGRKKRALRRTAKNGSLARTKLTEFGEAKLNTRQCAQTGAQRLAKTGTDLHRYTVTRALFTDQPILCCGDSAMKWWRDLVIRQISDRAIRRSSDPVISRFADLAICSSAEINSLVKRENHSVPKSFEVPVSFWPSFVLGSGISPFVCLCLCPCLCPSTCLCLHICHWSV